MIKSEINSDVFMAAVFIKVSETRALFGSVNKEGGTIEGEP
jgi:hypothetical protein